MTAPAAVRRSLRHGGVIRTVWRIAGERRRLLALAIGFRFLQAVCEAIPVGVLVAVVDDIRTDSLTSARAWQALAIYAACLAGQYGFGWATNLFSWAGTYEISGELRHAALEHLRRLPLGFLVNRSSGDTVTAVTTDVAMVENFVHAPLPVMLGGIWAPVLVFLVLCTVDVALAVVTMVSVVVSAPVFLWANRRFKALGARRQQLQAEANARMTEYVQGIAVIRAFGVQGSRLTRFRQALDDFRSVNTRMAVQLLPLGMAFVTAVMLGIPLVVFVGGLWLSGQTIDAGTFLVFLVLCLRVYQPLAACAEQIESLRIADASLDRIAQLMDAPEERRPAEPHEPPTRHDVVFEHVDFAYEPGQAVLRDVSFTVPELTTTAIVGPSGAGKSTILNLLARFYEADGGSIRVGGVDLGALTVEQVFDLVTFVFQDVYLFQGSIYDNIAFGRDHASRDAVHAAAVEAQADEFIRALPDGYDTRVGEGGATLSGGERQRISIARAILKDAPIVLLDEATASIDPTNERRVQEALARLARDRTVLVVAHRLSTIRHADQIVVLDGGTIVDAGRHDDLLARGGLYARFWQERERAARWRLGTGR